MGARLPARASTFFRAKVLRTLARAQPGMRALRAPEQTLAVFGFVVCLVFFLVGMQMIVTESVPSA